ncbi:hypothetical protein TNCV_809311 [Trichonephila clavipes]|uniref:Uncharacterized protein n=1 Tax=Trichonephila clavipes TaxID=2585209 RepID=A0A8X6VHZ7_TRICX|nr:hypothetical protein TNCV_809311 [Trichonephila clavipes]
MDKRRGRQLSWHPSPNYRTTPTGDVSALDRFNVHWPKQVLFYTAVKRPILANASPVWGYAAKTNISILDTLQNSRIRMIVKATRYMRNDDIPNRRVPMTVRTPAGSDPEHSDGTPSGTEVIPLAQHPIRELPLARERSESR